MIVSFAPLKALNSIVKGGIRGIKFEIFHSCDTRRLPAAIILVVVAMEHVVCYGPAEQVLVVFPWLFFENFSFLDDKVLGLIKSLRIRESTYVKSLVLCGNIPPDWCIKNSACLMKKN